MSYCFFIISALILSHHQLNNYYKKYNFPPECPLDVKSLLSFSRVVKITTFKYKLWRTLFSLFLIIKTSRNFLRLYCFWHFFTPAIQILRHKGNKIICLQLAPLSGSWILARKVLRASRSSCALFAHNHPPPPPPPPVWISWLRPCSLYSQDGFPPPPQGPYLPICARSWIHLSVFVTCSTGTSREDQSNPLARSLQHCKANAMR